MVAAVGRYRNDALSCATSRLRSAAARIEWEGQHTNLLLQNLSAIYVVHGSRLHGRRQELTRFLSGQGLRGGFITAFDQDAFTMADVQCFYPSAQAFAMYARQRHFPTSWVSMGELSCTVKHWVAFALGFAHAVVLEDDGIPVTDFVPRLHSFFVGWDAAHSYRLLLLSHYSAEASNTGKVSAVFRSPASKFASEYSATGYLISQAGAAWFLSSLPIRAQVDLILANTAARDSRGHLLFPTSTPAYVSRPTLVTHGTGPHGSPALRGNSSLRGTRMMHRWPWPSDLQPCFGSHKMAQPMALGGGRCPRLSRLCSFAGQLIEPSMNESSEWSGAHVSAPEWNFTAVPECPASLFNE